MAYKLEADRIAWSKQYYQKNKEILLKKHKDWYQLNREEVIKKNSEYFKNNRQKINTYNSAYLRTKRSTDENYRVSRNFSRGISRSLVSGKNGRQWEQVVGYTVTDLKKHLELKFDNKMSWDNYGKYWHIDHIKPIALFKYKTTDDDDFKECWSLDNLQPLEAIANLSKGKKYEI